MRFVEFVMNSIAEIVYILIFMFFTYNKYISCC